MSLPHIILGFLKTGGALSGYDLKGYIDESTRHFWYCDLSQIYRALDTLKENGWATGTEDPDNNRNRITYTLTPEGESELQKWLTTDFEFHRFRHDVLAKIFFGHFTPPERLREQILDYRRTFASLSETYQRIEGRMDEDWADYPDHVAYWLMTLDLGKRSTQATVEWCDAVLEKLNQLEKRE